MRPTEPGWRHPNARRAQLLAPAALGVLLALWNLGAKSFWVDEGASWKFASIPWGEFPAAVWEETNMLLYYLLLRLWLVGGSGEAWLRLLSALSFGAALALAAPLGLRVAGRRAGLWFAVLLALNVALVSLAQEARGYQLALALQVAAAACLARAAAAPAAGSRLLLLAAGLLGLSLWAHALSLFSVLGLGAWALWALRRRARPRALLEGAGLFALLLLPFALRTALGPRTAFLWAPPLGVRTLVHAAVEALGRGRTAGLLAAAVGTLAVAGALALRRGARAHPVRALPAVWLSVQGALLLAAGAAGTPLTLWRYLVFLLPPLLLLAAAGLSRLRPPAQGAVATLLLVLCSASLRLHYLKEPKEDWRAAARLVAAEGSPQDGVVVFTWFAQATFEYYSTRTLAGPVLLSVAAGPSRYGRPQPPVDPLALRAEAARRPRLFVLLSHHCVLGRDVVARDLLREIGQTHRFVARARLFDVDVLRFEHRKVGELEPGPPPPEPCG